jgi:hypothetical protein
VTAVDFSPDGTLIACVGDRSSVDDGLAAVVYSLLDGEAIQLRGANGAESICFSPDGRTIATGSLDSSSQIRLWDLARRDQRISVHAHDDPVRKVRFSPDGCVLASVSDDGLVRFWRAARSASNAGYDLRVLRTLWLPTADELAKAQVPERWAPTAGHWASGIEPLTSRLQRFPDDLFTAYQLAVLQLYLGHAREYRETADRLLRHFEGHMGSTRLSRLAEHVAMACLIDGNVSRDSVMRLQALLQRPDASDTVDDGALRPGILTPWGHLADGWIALRLANHQDAEVIFTQALNNSPSGSLEVMTRPGLCAALRAQGKSDESISMLRAARRSMESHHAWVESRKAPDTLEWQDWLACEILQQQVGLDGQ